MPPIEAHITEYRCHRRRCAACGHTTQAVLPDEVVGQFGPQLTALIAYLTVVCRLPHLVVQRLLAGALQIPFSLGTTQAAWEEASAAVAAPYAELQAALPREPVLNADEPGTGPMGTNADSGRSSRARSSSIVQWRKIMFGNRSDNGERPVERLLTVTRTCQLQQINALVYLTAAIAAHRRHQNVASLLRRPQTP